MPPESKLLACFHQNEALGGGGAESDEPQKSFDQGEVAILVILEENCETFWREEEQGNWMILGRAKIKACSVFPNSKRIKHVTNTNLAGWSVGESEEEGEGNVGNENHQEADPSPRPHS